jgi:predicted metal-dependent hydrolase
MPTQLRLGDITIEVIKKDIKNVHLSVNPPSGAVRVSAPRRMRLDTIRVFAISKLDWITKQQQKLREQERETPREYVDRESHYVWGSRYLLSVVEQAEPRSVVLKPGRLVLSVRPGADRETREAVVAQWYREQVRAVAGDLIDQWSSVLGVEVDRVFVQQMKTRWGSCNPKAHSIRLNTELAKKPKGCLEYVVVHEMTHMLEATHNARFIALMNQFIPQWESRRQQLNRLPVRHADWVL